MIKQYDKEEDQLYRVSDGFKLKLKQKGREFD